MKKYFIRILLFNILLLVYAAGRGQDINIKELKEVIQIREDSSFTKDVSVLINPSAGGIIYPIFYDDELEEVKNINVFVKKGRKYKALEIDKINQENVDIDFLTSKKLKSVQIPAGVEAKVTYSVSCPELMYFSSLPFFSYDEIDTLKYEISIPDDFWFSHDIIYGDSLQYFKIDSLKTNGIYAWNIIVAPQKVQPDFLTFFGIYKNMKMPLMRILVAPVSHKNNGREYLCNWYLDRLEANKGLDSLAQRKIDELTNGISDPRIIAETLFSYVKTNFKYVAIEIGMGAFVPTHANEVFLNKQGDCKDLSNFLSEALSYKGIKSCVALASTYNHIADCDFPSLVSANHVICAAYINDELILLDPTDPAHLPGKTVQSLQERSILIVNSDGGEYHKIEKPSAEENLINYNIDLNTSPDDSEMKGMFYVTYNGISGNFLKHAFIGLSEKEIVDVGEKIYESIFNNQKVSGFEVISRSYPYETTGKLLVKGKLINDKTTAFLFLDFMPKIIESEVRESLLAGTFLGSTVDKKVKLSITMQKPLDNFSPVIHSFSDSGLAFNLKISRPSEFVIQCEYEFKFDDIFIDSENLKRVNEFLSTFKNIVNEPIQLKYKD